MDKPAEETAHVSKYDEAANMVLLPTACAIPTKVANGGSARSLLILLYIFIIFVPQRPLHALDPHQSLSDLYHSAWTAREGIPGSIFALAQGNDGYLWVGTPEGLFRFDGLTFERYKPDAGSFAATSVSALLSTSDGSLWIGYLRGGASRLKNGKVTNFSASDGFPLARVRGFAQDAEGRIWAAAVGGLTRFNGHRWQRAGMGWNRPNESPTSLFLDRQGTFWVAGSDVIMYLRRGERQFRVSADIVNSSVEGFAQLPDGTLYAYDIIHDFVRKLPVPLSRDFRPQQQLTSHSVNLLVDRDGSLWIDREPVGLLRLSYPKIESEISVAHPQPGLDSFTEKQGLTGVPLTLLEDREGNVWIGTDGGLDRFRYRNLVWYPMPSGRTLFSIVAGDNGAVWVGTAIGGRLVRVQDQKLAPPGPEDVYVAYRDPNGTMWFGARNFFWSFRSGNLSKIKPPDSVTKANYLSGGRDPLLVTAISSDQSGNLWASIAGFGEFERTGKSWNFIPVVQSHPDWSARAAYTDAKDRLWLVFGEVVAMLDHGRVRVFSKSDGLTIGPPNSVAGYGERIFVGGESGLALFQRCRFYPVMAADGSEFGLITGIVDTPSDGVWMAAGPGIVHIPKNEIEHVIRDPSYKVAFELFDLVSDLPEPLQTGEKEYSPGVIQSTDALLWFATRTGVARIDPRHIVRNLLPPPVSIRAVIADGKHYATFKTASLPPLMENLEIDYAGLSLMIPERERFRYKLQGTSEDWQDAGSRRQAFYKDLAPGKYRFRVIACNNDGVWNQTGAEFEFRIAPAWYQTLWFQILCLLLGLSLLYFVYWIRMRQLVTVMRVRYNERFQERTRLAQDLHDTLLQTIQSSKMVVDEAVDSIRDVNTARTLFTRLSVWLGRANVEGRAVLDSLRHPVEDGTELISALQRIATDHSRCTEAELTVSVSGESRELNTIAKEEIYRVGEEAIRNACFHSKCTEIRLNLIYDHDLLLRIYDNGMGIPADIVERGREGHYGIVGMRERAERLRARIQISSSPHGTEISLRVPGRVAFRREKSVLDGVHDWLREKATKRPTRR